MHAVSTTARSSGRATGITIRRGGEVTTLTARHGVVLSAGALNTPRLLMLSGIGDEAELRRHGIRVAAKLPGVGRNFQDHVLVAGCIWEYKQPLPPASPSRSVGSRFRPPTRSCSC